MNELLTTKQVQELLQVDRTTIYRMLKDGRLSGVKVGSQWRFKRQEIDDLLSSANAYKSVVSSPSEVLPVHCIQSIQNVFAQIAEVGAITTDRHGQPITEISHCQKFCKLILASPTGKQACIASWERLAKDPDKGPEFRACHAGLQYARGCIKIKGNPTAMVIAGQFYIAPPDSDEETIRIRRLASVHGINHQELIEAALEIPVLDDKKQAQIALWMKEVANTFGEIGDERADMLERLKIISEVSNLEISD
jgi:excisionase family DNA binding protein